MFLAHLYSLRMLENRVLRSIFGPHREEEAGGWRRLRKEELRNLYSSPNIIKVIITRRMRLEGPVSTHGKHEK
jgi:hypothetical protein